MTEPLFREDAYARECTARVVRSTEGGVVLDRTVFYATGGGQPGDSGTLVWEGGEMPVATAVKGEGAEIVHVLAGGTAGGTTGGTAGGTVGGAVGAGLPPAGAEVVARLDWERRHRHMRVHTGLHLLSVVIPLPVTGGQITADKGRLDFDMAEPPGDKEALEAALNALVAADHVVATEWISDEELAARPEMVKTMAVKPPVGQGRVRLVRIGAEPSVDLQPCGGTHVRRTAEIGRLSLGKIEKKGRQNRRVSILIE